MNEEWIELVYDSLQGNLIEPLPGVKDAFAPGSECESLYRDVRRAYASLCQRLGKEDEDGDVETIINSLLRIQKVLCREMYLYGARFGNPPHSGEDIQLPED